jgi:hypothetical protein
MLSGALIDVRGPVRSLQVFGTDHMLAGKLTRFYGCRNGWLAVIDGGE